MITVFTFCEFFVQINQGNKGLKSKSDFKNWSLKQV